jgi:hypothetical protein
MSPYEPVREERRKEQGLQEDQISGGSTGYSCIQAPQKYGNLSQILLFYRGTEHAGFSVIIDLKLLI